MLRERAAPARPYAVVVIVGLLQVCYLDVRAPKILIRTASDLLECCHGARLQQSPGGGLVTVRGLRFIAM